MAKKLKVASMFAGRGGIDVAFEQAGYEIVWANEIDKYACRTYRLNFNEKVLVEGDIQEINTGDIPDFDVLVAGFPCQAFSYAGKRKGFGDTRGTLFFEVERLLRKYRPKGFLLENA